jgi:hypothetical protein
VDGGSTDQGSKQQGAGDQCRASNAQTFEEIAHHVTPTTNASRCRSGRSENYNPPNLST